MNAPRAILWVAVSSAPQAADDKASLPAQEADLRARAEMMGWRIVDVLRVPGHSRAYVDIHECAADMRAAGIDAFDRLFEHWRAADFDVLACRDGDRFGRKQTIFSHVVERTIDNGARLYTLADGWIDVNNFRMAISMGSYKAASEIDALKKRHHFGMTSRLRNGLPPNVTPATHVMLRDEKGRGIRLVVDESRRRLYDDIHDLLVRERAIIRGMETLLEARGHGRLGDRTVDHWFRSPYTWGHSGRRYMEPAQRRNWHWVFDPSVPVPDGVEIWRNTHEAVWTGTQAQEMFDEFWRRHAIYGWFKNPRRSYRYAGLLRCADCGGPITYQISDRKYRYLRCNNHCRTGVLREAVVDEAINGFLRLVVDGASLDQLFDAPADTSAAQAERLRAEIDQVTEQSRALIRKQAAAPPALYTLYDDELTALGTRLDALQRELTRLQPAPSRAAPDLAATELRTRGLEWFWAQSGTDQNAILHSLFGRWRLTVNARAVVGFRLDA